MRFNKALVLHAMKDYSGAIDIYSKLLEEKDNASIRTNIASAYVSLGDENLKQQNYTLSTQNFEKAIEYNTKDSYAYYGLAKSYRACGINEKASEYYEKAIAMSPEKLSTAQSLQNLFQLQIKLLNLEQVQKIHQQAVV